MRKAKNDPCRATKVLVAKDGCVYLRQYLGINRDWDEAKVKAYVDNNFNYGWEYIDFEWADESTWNDNGIA